MSSCALSALHCSLSISTGSRPGLFLQPLSKCSAHFAWLAPVHRPHSQDAYCRGLQRTSDGTLPVCSVQGQASAIKVCPCCTCQWCICMKGACLVRRRHSRYLRQLPLPLIVLNDRHGAVQKSAWRMLFTSALSHPEAPAPCLGAEMITQAQHAVQRHAVRGPKWL